MRKALEQIKSQLEHIESSELTTAEQNIKRIVYRALHKRKRISKDRIASLAQQVKHS